CVRDGFGSGFDYW
nr:immunoglobulin heavy chain junction region [Macaca mulatta]MOX95044.1 immunoglobulin heavy chain junction region [Macaca mulatta]MOX95854.1 immunoglobulin heavy chain junction region [Macaca mulatta]